MVSKCFKLLLLSFQVLLEILTSLPVKDKTREEHDIVSDMGLRNNKNYNKDKIFCCYNEIL